MQLTVRLEGHDFIKEVEVIAGAWTYASDPDEKDVVFKDGAECPDVSAIVREIVAKVEMLNDRIRQ